MACLDLPLIILVESPRRVWRRLTESYPTVALDFEGAFSFFPCEVFPRLGLPLGVGQSWVNAVLTRPTQRVREEGRPPPRSPFFFFPSGKSCFSIPHLELRVPKPLPKYFPSLLPAQPPALVTMLLPLFFPHPAESTLFRYPED